MLPVARTGVVVNAGAVLALTVKKEEMALLPVTGTFLFDVLPFLLLLEAAAAVEDLALGAGVLVDEGADDFGLLDAAEAEEADAFFDTGVTASF